jgi:hypothetical protein
MVPEPFLLNQYFSWMVIQLLKRKLISNPVIISFLFIVNYFVNTNLAYFGEKTIEDLLNINVVYFQKVNRTLSPAPPFTIELSFNTPKPPKGGF